VIALGIRFLTGRSVATEVSSGEAEWPPHPARVFMALAATHFETGAEPAERAALQWLEQCPAPKLRASQASRRTIYETYVPSNDVSFAKRSKQSRTFPSVRPDRDSVFLVWDEQPSAQVGAALSRLCQKVTRLGHSSSLAEVWLAEAPEAEQPNWLPDDSANHALRVPEAGLLGYLEETFKRDGEKPMVSTWQNYREVDSGADLVSRPAIESPFDPTLLVFEKIGEGPALGLESTLQLTGALRNAVLATAPVPHPEWLSGHQAGGAPSKHPHLAVFPLPFVGGEHGDGHVMGLAVALPRVLVYAEGSRAQALRKYLGPVLFDAQGDSQTLDIPLTEAEWEAAVAGKKLVSIWHEKAWRWSLSLASGARTAQTLDPKTWAGDSTCWATVTPIVLHHHPKKNRDGDVERIVREAFVSAGFPEPTELRTQPVSVFRGAGHVRDMPFYSEGGGEQSRYQVHAVARFARAVAGPMLVGRGRFRGYGLFRPWKEQA